MVSIWPLVQFEWVEFIKLWFSIIKNINNFVGKKLQQWYSLSAGGHHKCITGTGYGGAAQLCMYYINWIHII